MRNHRYACLPLLVLVACSAADPSRESIAEDEQAIAAAFPPPLACPVRTVGVVPADADGAWTVRTVDDRALLDPAGPGTTVAVESTGRVHVGWYTGERKCWNGPTGMYDIGALMHAYWDGAAWKQGIVNCRYERGLSPVMAVDAQDRVHAVYGTGDYNGAHQFNWYSLWNGAQWEGHSIVGSGSIGGHRVSVLPDCTNAPLVVSSGEVFTREGTSFNGENAPFEDASNVHVARDASGKLHVGADVMVPTGPSTAEGRARYAVFNGTSWKKEDPSGGAAATLVGLQVDSQGRPHVVYRVGRSNPQLWHAVRGSLLWSRERIPVDTMNAAFTIGGNDELLVLAGSDLARKNGTKWTSHTVAELIGAQYPSLTVDTAGTLHVAYYSAWPSSSASASYPRASVSHAVFAHR